MLWLDILLIVIIAGFIITGIVRGGIRGIFGLLGIILGIFGASRIYKDFATYLHISNPQIARAVSFIILFLAIVLLANLLGLLLHKATHFIGAGFLDRLLGLILGALKGTLFSYAICFFLILFPQGRNAVEDSKIAPIILTELHLLRNLFPKSIQKKLRWKTPRRGVTLKSAQALRKTYNASQSSVDSTL